MRLKRTWPRKIHRLSWEHVNRLQIQTGLTAQILFKLITYLQKIGFKPTHTLYWSKNRNPLFQKLNCRKLKDETTA